MEANDSKRVLCHDPSRSALAADAEKLAPKPPFVGAALPLAGDGGGLTGRSSDHSVNWSEVSGVDFSHVSEAGDVGPMAGEDSSAELINFHLGNARPAGPLEAEVHAADAREE